MKSQIKGKKVKSSKSKKVSSKRKISYNKNRNKKGGSNMNDVDIDEIGDVADALDLKITTNEYFGSGSGQKRGIFDSAKLDDPNMDAKRTEMPQLNCTIL
jgi:hypothetical protein